MKLRRQTIDIPDAIEREAEEAVRRHDDTKNVHGPSETYFANLLVRTNERLDRATSGVAISLSWLARVAVPGVVAIIFFFIGLHYYAPVTPRPSVAEVKRMVNRFYPGAWEPIMINERYFLIDGQHTLMVAKKLGLKYIDAIVANEKRLNES